MKIKIIIFFLLLTLVSCKSYNRDKFTYEEKDRAWINAYKYEVFYSCLKEGLKNDTIFKLMEKKDFFYPYDDIDIDERKVASLLGKKIIENISIPIIPHCDDCDENAEKKKNYISNNCLKYYASRELDSIAKEAYKLHLKRNNLFEH